MTSTPTSCLIGGISTKIGKLLPLPQLASSLLLPVQIRDETPIAASAEIELVLAKGRLRIQGRPDPDTLT